MVSQSRSEATIALGKRLVEQLGDDGDLSAMWLSHLLAERMTAVDQAHEADKKAAEDACVGLILELWAHRNQFSDRHRPLRDMDAVMRTLDTLDLDRPGHRYFAPVFRAVDAGATAEPAAQWLKLATEIDDKAKLLIRLALAQAVGAMETDAAEWVTLAAEAVAQEPAEALVLHFIWPDKPNTRDLQNQATARQLQDLRDFIDLAEQLAQNLERQLQTSSVSPKPS